MLQLLGCWCRTGTAVFLTSLDSPSTTRCVHTTNQRPINQSLCVCQLAALGCLVAVIAFKCLALACVGSIVLCSRCSCGYGICSRVGSILLRILGLFVRTGHRHWVLSLLYAA